MSSRPSGRPASASRGQPPHPRLPKLETGSYTLSGGAIKTEPTSLSVGISPGPANRPMGAKLEPTGSPARVKRERADSPEIVEIPRPGPSGRPTRSVPAVAPAPVLGRPPAKKSTGRRKVAKAKVEPSSAGPSASGPVTIDFSHPDVMEALTGSHDPIGKSFNIAQANFEASQARALALQNAGSMPVDGHKDEEPKAKRAKKGEGKEKAPEEKRLNRERKKAPVAVLERLDRVRLQRMFLVDRERHPEGLYEIFKVLGSTGNVYTITVGLTPTCDCPDGQKNGTCKHIIFVMLKVLQTPETGTLWYQRSLLTTELAELFAHAPPSPQQSALAAGTVRSGYRAALGREPEADPFGDTRGAGGLPDKRMPEQGEDCPVCYDEFEVGEAGLHFCLVPGGCGKAIHVECARQWTQTKRNKGEEITCVWCRASWASLAAPAPAQSMSIREGYLNFGGVAGLASTRDASSYYHGPRRGERYNFHRLADRYR